MQANRRFVKWNFLFSIHQEYDILNQLVSWFLKFTYIYFFFFFFLFKNLNEPFIYSNYLHSSRILRNCKISGTIPSIIGEFNKLNYLWDMHSICLLNLLLHLLQDFLRFFPNPGIWASTIWEEHLFHLFLELIHLSTCEKVVIIFYYFEYLNWKHIWALLMISSCDPGTLEITIYPVVYLTRRVKIS